MDHIQTVFRSLDAIENRIAEKLSVEKIAGSVHFSKYHYERLFRETVGDSVMRYVVKRKLTLAGRALLDTDDTILDIALRYGYDSHEGFARGFKAYMGVTPTEYRKYGLTAISQRTIKERRIMIYSNTTNEILRELNRFTADVRETAAFARTCDIKEYKPFWVLIADKTDAFAERLTGVIGRISSISERPDEITNRFTILKVLEDIAFESNLMAFNISLMVSRGQPTHVEALNPFTVRYIELARASALNTGKIAKFLSELSSLIIESMRKEAIEKMDAVVKTGKAALEGINGYDYIKDEIAFLVNEITSKQYEDITVQWLEDCLFKLNIICFAAEMDVFRWPADRLQFEGVAVFKDCLIEVIDFYQALVKPDQCDVVERDGDKYILDIAFQGNILYFYTKGEISHEKIGKMLNDEQKAAYKAILERIAAFIQYTLNATDRSALKIIADTLYGINGDMVKEADKLKDVGGAVYFLASEFKRLADTALQCANDNI